MNFTLNMSAGHTLSNVFWGTTISGRARILTDEGTLVNATPTEIVVWPGANAAEYYDPLLNRFWTDGAPDADPPQTSEADFVSWCESIHCQAIMQVPGEIDNASFAAAIVNYTVNTLHFSPAYWEIGNEPELWKCWGMPWTEWVEKDCPGIEHRKDDKSPTPAQYAWEVNSYAIAMRQVDPALRLIGVPATGRNNGPYPVGDWVYNTTLINGANLSAVAYHEYPVGSKTEVVSPAVFYSSITPDSTVGMVQRTLQVQQNISAAGNASGTSCPASCARNIKIFITEIGSGISRGVNYQYESSFPGALSLAAQMTEAMDLNVSNLDVFAAVLGTANSWFNFTGGARPDYTLYSQILNHLGSVVYPVNFSLPGPKCAPDDNTTLDCDLYGIGTIDPAHQNRSDLMLVNVNVTNSVVFNQSGQLVLPGIGPITNQPLEVWTWSAETGTNNWFTPATSSPVPYYFPHGLPLNWTLGPQTVALIESYPGGGFQVQFNERGFTPSSTLGPRWYLTVGGMFEEANATPTITDFLPSGNYNINAIPIPLPLGGIERVPKERYEPFPPSSIHVGSQALAVTIPFVQQWATNVSIVPGDSPSMGSVGPQPAWWNASTPITVTAHPAFGYVFTHWVEFENYSGANYTQVSTTYPANLTYANITGLSPSIESWVNGSMRINASFAPGYPVSFVESGLPAGSGWSVIVRNSWDDSENVTHHEAIYQFDKALNESVIVAWKNTTRLRNWTVVDSTTLHSVVNSLPVEEANGTIPFSVVAPPGYRSLPVSANFTVAGSPVTVPVTFTPITGFPRNYTVTFQEHGLPTGSRWSIELDRNNSDHESSTSTGSTLVIDRAPNGTLLLNGTYGYNASTIPGWRAHPANFSFVISGANVTVAVNFSAVTYDVIWQETGLADLRWNVSVSGALIGSVGAWTTAELTNGSYAYRIPDVLDYLPNPQAGTFVVNGAGRVFSVTFSPAMYAVTFDAEGLPSGDTWTVEFHTSDVAGTASTAAYEEPNGTYDFNITPPQGYSADPSHGWVSVVGSPMVVSIQFVSLGIPPTPPVWNLAIPALEVTAVVALAALVTFLLVGVGRRRRRSGGNT